MMVVIFIVFIWLLMFIIGYLRLLLVYFDYFCSGLVIFGLVVFVCFWLCDLEYDFAAGVALGAEFVGATGFGQREDGVHKGFDPA